MSEFLLRFYCTLLLSVVYVTAEETVGYSVLVSFAQNVAFENGKTLLDNAQESLQEASNILHEAIGHQFSKVTFQIPSSWDTAEWNIPVEKSYRHDREKPDMLIDSTNDVVFGKFPFARQYGSCGIPGHQIIIPAAFFHENNTFPRGISLAREWLKYRYGVFDENGYLGDPLYPTFYTIPGRDPNEVQVTDCTNLELTYKFVDDNNTDCSTDELTKRLEKGECRIDVDNSLENVTSSLMYYEEKFTHMTHVCGKDGHKHNSRSPNKQNVLCNGKNIWESINNSPNYKIDIKSEEFTEIKYVYVQEAKPKIVVAWEDTERMSGKGDAILFAVNNFIIDLPYGSMFSEFSFTDSVDRDPEPSLRELNSLDDKRLVSQIKFDFEGSADGNVTLAISKAIDILQSSGIKDSELAADIIIITGSRGNSSDSNIIEKLKGLQKVCIKILLLSDGEFPDEDKDYENFPCVTVNKFPMSGSNEELSEKLYESMEKLLPLTTDDKATETVKTQYLRDNSITYEADAFTETVTFLIFTQKTKKIFNLRFNEEQQQLNSLTFGNVLSISFPIQQAGTIGLSYKSLKADPALVQVRATSAERKYFSGEVVVHNPSQESDVQMPVIIYAIVRFGPYPLQNAKVSAVITDPTEIKHEFDLFDDGIGDPDITQNDGIYSRYFTAFSQEGVYTVTINVRNDENLATYGADENAGYQTCCGSFVKNGTSTELGDFSKTYIGTFTAVSGRPAEGYKPSRITDLRIGGVTDDKITLKWSAPGGEADSGKASRYEINLFCETENIENNSTTCSDEMVQILDKPTPLNYGNEQQVTIQNLKRTHRLSVSIMSVNEKNISSDTSNTIQIFEPSEVEEPTIEPVLVISQADKAGLIVAYFLMGILVLTCIGTATVCYRKRKSRKAQSDESGAKEVKVNYLDIKSNFNSIDHPIKHELMKRTESFPVLLYTHDQIKDRKEKDKGPPLYKEGATPKDWKSLEGLSSLRKASDSDTRSASSSSTMNPKEV